MKDLSNKIALVTGASSGFGAGIVKHLSKAGAKVYIAARNAGKLESVAKETAAFPIVADITDPNDWDKVFEIIIKENNHLDILINNAGSGGSIRPINEQDDTNIIHTIQTNLTGAILGSKRAAAVMKKQHSGTIVNISSVCSFEAWPGWSVYGAAKAGLEQFTRHLYVEMRPYGIKATILIPSWGATNFNINANIEPFTSDVIGKVIQPDDIGKIVADICKLPDHLIIPEMILLPMTQEIIPY